MEGGLCRPIRFYISSKARNKGVKSKKDGYDMEEEWRSVQSFDVNTWGVPTGKGR